MHPDLVTALRLQELDLQIAALRAEIATLPKQIAVIERQLAGHLRQLELDKANLTGNLNDRKKLDLDIQTHQQKISKLKDQTMQAKTNEQYRAFQHEIEYCEKEVRKCEDRILDLMGEAEMLEKKVKDSSAALIEEKKKVDAEKSHATELSGKDKAALARALEDRKAAAEALSPQVLATYERLRAKTSDGRPIAEVVDGVCKACQLALRPQYYQDLKISDSVMTCENCRRLLFLQPAAVDVEAQNNA